MQSKWQLQDAKNRFSQVVDEAVKKGPQVITRRGRDTAVLLSMDDYKKLKQEKSSLADFLLNSPLRGSGLLIERSKDLPRDIEL